jgi:hypothetical protein
VTGCCRWILAAALAAPLSAVAQEVPEELGQAGAVFAGYVGSWDVTVKQPGDDGELVDVGSGSAVARARLGGRFLEIETMLAEGPLEHLLYVLGFDTRHRRYTILAMDNSGTYWVTAAADSTVAPPHIVMYGTDDDPRMTAMGFEKAFAFVWHLASLDRFWLETRWIDTRTEAREEIVFMALEFVREEP